MAAAVDLVYLYGKVLRPDALMQIEGYRPVLSLQRFLDFQILSWSDLLLTWNRFGWRTVLGICIVLSFFAWRLRRPVLRFCWLFFLIAPLPIEFLVGRTGACLAIPFCGLAIFVAVTFVGLTRALANLLRWRLCREIVFALICLSALALWARQNHTVKQLYVKPAMDETGRETWAVIEQLRSLDPHIRPRSSVVFLNDPFEGYDMAFIAEAFFRDPSLVIRLGRKTPISQQELAAADYLFTFDGGSLVRLR